MLGKATIRKIVLEIVPAELVVAQDAPNLWRNFKVILLLAACFYAVHVLET